MKRGSTVYMGREQAVAMECDRYERKRGRIKFSPYKQVDHAIQAATIQRGDEQVTYTIKTNVHTVSTHKNETAIQWNADVVYTVSTMKFLCTTCLLYTSRCV